MQVVHTKTELRQALEGKESIGLVPTMGALHSGHLTLVDAASTNNDTVVVSIFANPLQFENLGECDDFRNYPRQLDADLELLTGRGVDIVFAPEVEEMYPTGAPLIWVRTGAMGEKLEGVTRPGHFDGVATVVTKLFSLIAPDRAYFGQKDVQQLAIIRRMVKDLDIPVDIVGVPIVRADDGLAESSRNLRLNAEQRQQALVLSQVLFALKRDEVTLEQAREKINNTEGVRLDYLLEVDPSTLEEGTGLLLGAMYVGPVRLIDNIER